MDDIVTQLGLLLTQTRFARRALEDIERSTAQYASFAFTVGLPAAAVGRPPLLDGALRVHVDNIADLSAPSGSGDAFSGLLGGIGSFLGNLFGGAVGGTIASVSAVALLRTIDSIAGRIERIIDKLGLSPSAAPPPPAPAASAASAAPAPAAAGGQSQFLALLATTSAKIDMMTRLLAAAGGTAAPAAGAPQGPSLLDAPDAERWRAWLGSVTAALDSATRLVGGLVVAVPTAISALAWVLDRLPDVRNAITDTLRFVVRNVLLLRGAVIVLALETVAMIARVAAMAVRTLAATIDAALAALFSALAQVLAGALKLGEILGRAVTDTVNQLLGWLVPAVYKILGEIGELRLFRVIEKLVDALPALLALTGGGAPQPTPAPPGGAAPAGTGFPPPPPPPDLAAIMAKAAADAKDATDKLTDAAKKMVDGPANALRQGLADFGERLDEAAIKEAALSETNLAERLSTLGERATRSAETLLPRPAPAARQNVWDRIGAQTPFHPIAAAYGQWLAAGGLVQLLEGMRTYFVTPPSVPDVAERGRVDAAVVQIDEVIIEIVPEPAAGAPSPPTPSGWGPGDFPVPAADDDLDRWAGRQRLDEIRGSRGRRRPHVPVFG